MKKIVFILLILAIGCSGSPSKNNLASEKNNQFLQQPTETTAVKNKRTLIAEIDNTGKIKIFDIDLNQIKEIETGINSYALLSWSPNGQYILAKVPSAKYSDTGDFKSAYLVDVASEKISKWKKADMFHGQITQLVYDEWANTSDKLMVKSYKACDLYSIFGEKISTVYSDWKGIVHSPEWDPSGQYLVWTGEMNKKDEYHIFIFDSIKGNTWDITPKEYESIGILGWFGDENIILFASKQDGKEDYMLMNYRTGEYEILFDYSECAEGSGIKLSNSGEWIAYVEDDKSNNLNIIIQNIKTGKKKVIDKIEKTNDNYYVYISGWSPSDEYLKTNQYIWPDDGEVFLIKINSKQKVKIQEVILDWVGNDKLIFEIRDPTYSKNQFGAFQWNDKYSLGNLEGKVLHDLCLDSTKEKRGCAIWIP